MEPSQPVDAAPEPPEQLPTPGDHGAATPGGGGAAVPRSREASERAGDEPGPAAEPPARRRRWPLVLAVVVGAVSVACATALGVGYVSYDRLTEPDRGTPAVTVRQYLEATLNERSPGRAKLFECAHPRLDEVTGLLDELRGKEQRFQVRINAAAEDFQVREESTAAQVAVLLRLSVAGAGSSQEQIQHWEFEVTQESGWRVCGAHRVG